MNCCIRWPLCGADVTGRCPNAVAAKAAQGLLDAHPMDCPCLACLHAFGAVAQARAWTAPPLSRCPTCCTHHAAGERCPLCAARPSNGRAWTVTVPSPDTAAAPTVRPPADQRCTRCDRVLIAAPCPCVTPVERAIASGRAHREDMARLTPAERIAAWRAISSDRPITTEIL